METASVYAEADREALRFKWIESEVAGRDLGEAAVRRWFRLHWHGFLRARWLEHLKGRRFWVELDHGNFALVRRRFRDDDLLLDRVLDRLAAGRENLDVLHWGVEWGLPIRRIVGVLEALDVHRQHLPHPFDRPDRPEVPLVRVDPAWLAWDGGTVRRLARHIAEAGDFDALPVLGDALEEAGCVEPAILGHCRSAGRVGRRSWLVDLLLWGE